MKNRHLVLLFFTLYCDVTFSQMFTHINLDSIKNLLVGTWEFEKTKPESNLLPGQDVEIKSSEESPKGTVSLVKFCDDGKFYDLEEFEGITTIKDSGFWYFESVFGFLNVERIISRDTTFRKNFPDVFDYIYLKMHGVDTTWFEGDMFYEQLKIDTSDIDRADTLFYFNTTVDTKWIELLSSSELRLAPPFGESPMDNSEIIVYSYYYKRREN